MFYTLIELRDGVLSYHVEGVMEVRSWRALVAPALCFLQAQGGGRFLVPHALSCDRP